MLERDQPGHRDLAGGDRGPGKAGRRPRCPGALGAAGSPAVRGGGVLPGEIAHILRIEEAEVREKLGEARETLQQRVMVPVLIIEDEPMIAMELKDLVESMGLRVTHVVARQEEASAAAASEPPGLVLSDIQLQDDGSGIEAARDILQQYEVPIVFVTGFPERLLTGEGLEPAFVVAKPFKEDGLKITIAQALSTYAAAANAVEHRAKLLAKLRHISTRELQARAERSAS
ncbi:MAG: response regulator [Rhizobiales bacterium]|nr:response regulator [Hyphomicrobiales bacterium]